MEEASVLHLWERLKEVSLCKFWEPRQVPEGRQVQTCVWPWGTRSPAPRLLPVGPSAARPGWTPGPCLEHMAGTRLTSGKSIVAMRFLPTPLCYPADRSLCFSQSFPLTRWWSQLKTLIQHSDPPPCHSESFSMSESSLLPSLQPRMKWEKRREERDKFLERRDQKLLGHH